MSHFDEVEAIKSVMRQIAQRDEAIDASGSVNMQHAFHVVMNALHHIDSDELDEWLYRHDLLKGQML